MLELLAALLSAADPIEPTSIVAMPLTAFWSGLVALFVVAIAVVKTAYTVGQLKAIVDNKLAGLHEDHQRFEARINRHSDLFDSNEKSHHDLDMRVARIEMRKA